MQPFGMNAPLCGAALDTPEANAARVPPVRTRWLWLMTLFSVALSVQGLYGFIGADIETQETLFIVELTLFIFGVIMAVVFPIVGCVMKCSVSPRRQAVRAGILDGSVACFSMAVPTEDYAAFAEYYYGPGGPWRKMACALPLCLEAAVFLLTLLVMSLKKLGYVLEDFWGTEHIFFFIALAFGFACVPLGRLGIYLFAVKRYRARFGHSPTVLFCASQPPLFVMDGHVVHPPLTPATQLYHRGEAWSLVVAYQKQAEKNDKTTVEYPVTRSEARRLHDWLSDTQRQPGFRYIGASDKTKIGTGALKFGSAQLMATAFQAKFNDYHWMHA